MTISAAAVDPQRACPELEQRDAFGRLQWGLETFGEGFALTTSFGIQAAVSLHLISRLDRPVPVIWVDTGYLPPETYTYAEELMQRLNLRVHVAQSSVSPARMEALHGRLWETGQLEDLETYHRIRKVEPLDRAMAELNVSCWASGVRGRQTDHRSAMQPLELVRGRWLCGRCSTGPAATSTTTCRSTTCPSTPSSLRAIPRSATGTPVAPMTAAAAAGPPVSVGSSRNAEIGRAHV